MPAPTTLITIITPCYNEGQVVIRFLRQLEQTLASLPFTFSVVVVDDSSADDTFSLLNRFSFDAPNCSLMLVPLTSNMGHQAAILHGFIAARDLPSNHFIVMDADGQDAPEVIPALLARMGTDIVHVVRGRRNESLPFRIGYRLYRMLFKTLTGEVMNYGNFCLLSRAVVETAIAAQFRHLPAFLARLQLSRYYLYADRQKRIGGTSKMGFGSLCAHAYRSVAEYRNGNRYKRLLP